MNHEPYSELASAYALGALEGEERSRFEDHLRAGCRECEPALREYQESLAALAAELEPEAPPPSVKAALVRRIEARVEPVALEARPRALLWRWGWAGALAATLLVVGYLGVTVNALNRDLARQSGELAALRAQVTRQRELLALVSAPETRVVSLAGLEPSPTASARMWWHRTAGGFFVASGLPAPPSGKTYQLWVIAERKPVSAGVFDVDPKGSGILQVKPLPGVDKAEMFAVTLEPAGGLPQPSGEMYLAGKAG
jgi:anti-sigma-K factor RskA